MEKRTIKNIEKESYPEIGNLIRNMPSLFEVSELIGIFEGKDICSSFLLNSEYLKTITFYENFQFTDNPSIQETFKSLYKSWEEQISNLKVHIENGNNFRGNSTFVLIDTTEPLSKFIENNSKKLKKSMAASPGFGVTLSSTVEMSKCIIGEKIFPIFLYRDYLFYCFSKKRQKSTIAILDFFYSNNPKVYKRTFGDIKTLYINDRPQTGYFNDLRKYK